MNHWRAITLDLDDTLWPVWPAIDRAEAALQAWLLQHAPATAARFELPALRLLRQQVAADHPEQAHDLSWLREASIGRALSLAGDDPALARPAFEEFFEHRQRVELFPEVAGALARLASRRSLMALTNGNADLRRIGLDGHFVGSLSAREFGRGKPHPSFFHEACRRLGLAPEQVLHVGDDWDLDIEGAHGAGMASVWLRRTGHPSKPRRHRARPWKEIDSLDALVVALD
jgi:putative hydrolase of the HAD superfamily